VAPAAACRRAHGQNAARGGAAAYIRISEFEIADDYPMPLQYKVQPVQAAAAGVCGSEHA
jgi:hypothetical protein